MKKIICVVLALVCMLAAVTALATPSKTTEDLDNVKIECNVPGNENAFIRIIHENDEGYDELKALWAQQLEKLAGSESPEAYFGSVHTVDGASVSLSEALGTQQLNVNEFWAIVARNFTNDCGTVTAQLMFATPYAKGEAVQVLIGQVGADTVDWTACPGEGLGETGNPEYAGSIQVAFPQEVVLQMQNSPCLVAVVSK